MLNRADNRTFVISAKKFLVVNFISTEIVDMLSSMPTLFRVIALMPTLFTVIASMPIGVADADVVDSCQHLLPMP